MGLSKMDLFGNVFPDEANTVKEIEETYRAELAEAGGSKSKIDEATRKYHAALEKAASQIISHGNDMDLQFPISVELLRTAIKDKAYKEANITLHDCQQGAECCCVCGKPIESGEIEVVFTDEGCKRCHLDCADDDLVIDNDSVCLMMTT